MRWLIPLLNWSLVLLQYFTPGLKTIEWKESERYRRDILVQDRGSDTVGEERSAIRYEIRMPGVKASKDDEYICQGWTVPDTELYIVKFEALADGTTVHHLILFGCPGAVSQEPWTDCNTPCNGGGIIYAWARNAPSLQLPKNVGFQIGSSAHVNYLALQIHYKNPSADPNFEDHSGVIITVTKEKQKFVAGIFLLLSNSLVIPAHMKTVHGDVSCYFDNDTVLYPFAFRTHAHSMGRVISGYHYNGSWHLLGKGNPLWPQAFWPVREPISIKKGDALIARCTYDASSANESTSMGMTHHDEMCNFYMMYYTDPASGKAFYICNDNNIPDLVKGIPSDSDVTLPPNPYLDSMAEGGSHEEVEEVYEWTKNVESSGLALGQVSGVAVDAEGNVYIFHRGRRVWDLKSFDGYNRFNFKDEGPIKEKTVVQLNASTGDVVTQWANDTFYMPHGLHVDSRGNFWITDVALHQVMKFGSVWSTGSNANQPELILGKEFEPGSDESHFCKPTDVAVLHSGEFFVSDGYCNSRIMKFSKDGKLLAQWGEHSKRVASDGFPPSLTFDLPHSVVVLENRRTVCVGDRENRRVQCFTFEGKFLSQIHPDEFKPKLLAITYSEVTGNLYAVSGPSQLDNNPTLLGTTIDMETGALLNSWKPTTSFHHPHDIAVSPNGRFIYVVEIGPNRIWQFRNNNNASNFHQSVKKAGAVFHPFSSGNDDDTGDSAAEDKMKEEKYFGATLIIGGLIIVPIIVMIVVLIFLRYRRRGKQMAAGASRSHNRRFNLGSLLSRSQSSELVGRDDEQRLELKHLQSDSEVEEYSSVNQQKA